MKNSIMSIKKGFLMTIQQIITYSLIQPPTSYPIRNLLIPITADLLSLFKLFIYT